MYGTISFGANLSEGPDNTRNRISCLKDILCRGKESVKTFGDMSTGAGLSTVAGDNGFSPSSKFNLLDVGRFDSAETPEHEHRLFFARSRTEYSLGASRRGSDFFGFASSRPVREKVRLPAALKLWERSLSRDSGNSLDSPASSPHWKLPTEYAETPHHAVMHPDAQMYAQNGWYPNPSWPSQASASLEHKNEFSYPSLLLVNEPVPQYADQATFYDNQGPGKRMYNSNSLLGGEFANMPSTAVGTSGVPLNNFEARRDMGRFDVKYAPSSITTGAELIEDRFMSPRRSCAPFRATKTEERFGSSGFQKEKPRLWDTPSGCSVDDEWDDRLSSPKSLDKDLPMAHPGTDMSSPTYYTGLEPQRVSVNMASTVTVTNTNPLNDTDTTLMLRNIPNKYGRDLLLTEIRNQGFDAKFDFFYLPIDFRHRCNVGYAFINLVSNADAKEFQAKFNGFKLNAVKSSKVCDTSRAKVQGKFENADQYRNSSVINMSEKYHPLFFCDGVEIPFPAPRVNVVDAQAEATKTAAPEATETAAPKPGFQRVMSLSTLV